MENDGWIVGRLWARNQNDRVLLLHKKDIETKAGFRSVLSWVYKVGLWNKGDKLEIMRSIGPFDLIRRWYKDEITDEDRLHLEEAALNIADGEF